MIKEPKNGFENVYRLSPTPSTDGPPEVVARRLKRYDEESSRVKRLRSAAFALFNGAGTGMIHPATDHTVWGFVQAVTEMEDCRRGSPIGGETFGRTRDSESTLFGSRARAKERAMAEALTMAGIVM